MEDWGMNNHGNDNYSMERASEKNDSIGNNSRGVISERDDDFDIMDDGYEQKMEQKQTNEEKLRDEEQQELLYGPANKPEKKNEERQPEISVYDIENNLINKSTSILTYGKTLDTIVQYVNAFSLDELKKFVRLVLDVPKFNVTFVNEERKKKQRKERKVREKKEREEKVMLMKAEEEELEEKNLLEFSRDENDDDNNHSEVESDISAESFFQESKESNTYVLPVNGVQMMLDIIAFLCDMVDKCTDMDNPHLQEIIKELLQMNSKFFTLPLTPETLISEFNEFLENTVAAKKYEQAHEKFEEACVNIFEYSEKLYDIKQVIYFMLATRCVNNLFIKEIKENRLSIKMKVHCIKVLNEFEEASAKYFAKFKLNQELEKYIIPKGELNKLSKGEFEDYSTIIFTYCHKSEQKLGQYVTDIINQLISQESSIDKKCLGFKMIDKLILNTKLYPQTIKKTIMFLEENDILRRFMNDHTHGQLLRRLPPVMKFLYEENRVGLSDIKMLVESVVRSHEEFYKVVLSLMQYLSVEHLEEMFSYLTENFGEQRNGVVQNINGEKRGHYHTTVGNELGNPHVAGIVASIVGNANLGMICKRKKKELMDKQVMKESGRKEEKLLKASNNNANDININNNSDHNNNEPTKLIQHPLIYHLFHFLLNLIQEPNLETLYTPTLCKHLSLHLPLLLPLLEHQLTSTLTQPKHYTPHVLSLLEYVLKLDIDAMCNEYFGEKRMKIVEEKEETIKYQFVNNIVSNCNLYDSLMYILCKNRRDKLITEKCLNILILITKSYKPLEKSLIELLWKILGLHSINQFEKEQFFQFIKELIKNSINLTEESVKHIYFEIILKLHYDWFTPKIYDCFEMLFMRLNEDGKLLAYENGVGGGGNGGNGTNAAGNGTAVYHLVQTELVGLEKFYYLYFWAETKVSKKVKDFLYKLYNNYKSTPEIKQKLSYETIHTIMSYLLRNEHNEDHILHANEEKDYQQHMMRGFELLLKFMDARAGGGDDGNNEDSMITVTIHNVTRGAAPPIKRSLEVNKNMLLKEFKELIRKELNPPINDIELINKGKPLKVEKMSLKELKIENKNTILVENMDDIVPQRKESEERKLGELKETLVMIFGEQHEMGLLEYIAEKYLGEQMEKICEWIMDEDRIKDIENEYKQKKLAKIEEDKEELIAINNINKKKGIIANENTEQQQVLTFSEILGKEIDLLLGIVLDDEKGEKNDKRQQLIDRQWQVIKKIPLASVELARKIMVELDEEWIDFEKMFNSSGVENNVNTQAYTWHVLGKLVGRKSDEYKNHLRNDKSLELWVVGELERMINEGVYSYELYHEMIDCHESIVQGVGKKKDNMKQEELNNQQSSIFSLLKMESNFNPTNIITKINESILKNNLTNFSESKIIKERQFENKNDNYGQETILFSNLELVGENLLKMMTTKHPDPVIIEKLLSFLLYDVVQQHTHLQRQTIIVPIAMTFLEIDKRKLNKMLTLYKQPLLVFYLTLYVLKILSQLNNLRSGDLQQLEQRLLKDYMEVKDVALESLSLQEQEEQQQHHTKTTIATKEWMYFLMAGLIELLQRYTNNSEGLKPQPNNIIQKDLLYFISLIKQEHEKIETNSLIGLLAIVIELVGVVITVNDYQQRHIMMIQNKKGCSEQFVERNMLVFEQFIDFLTNQFIYTTPGVPILTSPRLKELHYQLLINLSTLSLQLLAKTVDRIIMIDVIKRNHDHDNVDFRKQEQFVGIQNLGCTCYINSLIQQLYHTRLPYELLGLNEEGVFELNHAFMQLYMSTKNVINIKPMIQQVKFYGQEIIPNIQQDVEEFLISLLDYIESCNGRTIIDKIFGGSYSEELTYFSEKEEGRMVRKHKEEHFYNITLDIKGKRTLNEALVYFFRSQQLDDKIYCEELDEKAPAVKRSFIKHFPKILIFTLKRFEFDMENMVRNKLNDYLEFPMDLDLTEFSLEKFMAEHETEKRMEVEEENDNGKMFRQEEEENQNNNRSLEEQEQQHFHSYLLCGILIHSGSAETGHYYSYIQRDKQWFEFNDRIVSEINLQEIIKSECFGGGGDSKTRNAYMLFYEKVERELIDKKNEIVVEKMEIEGEEHKMINEQNEQQNEEQTHQLTHHHGIFLNQIPETNFFKQLVKEENNEFIKERLIYDVEYRKFIDCLVKRAKDNVRAEEEGDKDKEFLRYIRLMTDKLKKLEKINSIINPKQQKPIVHFAASELMEIEEIKQEEFEIAKRYQEANRHEEANDFLNDLIEGRENEEQYQQEHKEDYNNDDGGDYI